MMENLVKIWNIDQDFIERVMDSLSDADVLSLDIFDTSLTRIVDSPADVFAELEKRLSHTHGKLVKGFGQAREDAEGKARRTAMRRGSSEVSLADIYAQLTSTDYAGIADEARALELTVEDELLVAVPDIIELVRRVRELGKKYIFVSDMYLPSEFLKKKLISCGFEDFSGLFVSNETNSTKHDASIWGDIDYNGKKIIHVGDDEWADFIQPKTHSIETFLYGRVRSERRVGSILKPSILPYSYAQRANVLQRAAAGTQYDRSEAMKSIGSVLGVLVTGSFLNWLAECVRQHGLRKIFFMSRDGWLLKKSWEAAGMDQSVGVEIDYLYVARRPLNFACGYISSTDLCLDLSLREFLSTSDNTVTVDLALRRSDLYLDPIVEDALETFGSLDVVLTWADGQVGRFSEMLARHPRLVRDAMRPHYENLVSYLRQQGFFDQENPGIVDLGWHGSMQRSLKMIMNSVGVNGAPRGFYFGLWSKALSNRYAAGFMDAAFSTEFKTLNEQAAVHQAVDLLEELNTAPEGTVEGYEFRDGAYQAVLADSPPEAEQFELFVRPYQDAVVLGIGALFRGLDHHGLKSEDLTIENALAALSCVILSPSSEELMALSQIGHSSTFDHSTLSSIVAADMPEKENRIDTLYQYGWKIGSLRNWHKKEEQRGEVNEIARQQMSHLGERTLRQFW